MKFYSLNEDGGYTNLDLKTQYCYVDFMNVPKLGGNKKFDPLFNLYSELIKANKDEFIRGQSQQFFNTFHNSYYWRY